MCGNANDCLRYKIFFTNDLISLSVSSERYQTEIVEPIADRQPLFYTDMTPAVSQLTRIGFRIFPVSPQHRITDTIRVSRTLHINRINYQRFATTIGINFSIIRHRHIKNMLTPLSVSLHPRWLLGYFPVPRQRRYQPPHYHQQPDRRRDRRA